jgi:DNA transformation protein
MTDAELAALVRERLEPLPATGRAMFGGRGLYLDGTFFGVIFDGKLYFRTDDESRPEYVKRGMPALQPPPHRPRGPKTVDRNFEVPPNVLADARLLKEWALRAAAAKR